MKPNKIVERHWKSCQFPMIWKMRKSFDKSELCNIFLVCWNLDLIFSWRTRRFLFTHVFEMLIRRDPELLFMFYSDLTWYSVTSSIVFFSTAYLYCYFSSVYRSAKKWHFQCSSCKIRHLLHNWHLLPIEISRQLQWYQICKWWPTRPNQIFIWAQNNFRTLPQVLWINELQGWDAINALYYVAIWPELMHYLVYWL